MGDDLHRLEVEPVEQWVARSADRMAEAMADSLAARGRCLLALSGGATPGPVLTELATRDLEWDRVTIIQVDERLAPAGHPDRNLTTLEAAFDGLPVAWLPLPVDRLLAAAVDPDQPIDPSRPPSGGTDPSASGGGWPGGAEVVAGPALDPEVVAEVLADFTCRLVELADEPPVIDVVQLGLGADGHTASLVAGDPAVMELRRYVALTGLYQGRRRLTLTRPVFDRAHRVIWLVRGPSKAEALGRLLVGDLSIPAGVIRPRSSLVLADTDAARQHY